MPPPPTESVGSFLGALRASRLLSPAQLAEVERRANEAPAAPQSLAQLLLQWGWATPYQMDQLFLGRGHNLVLGAYHLLDRIGEGATGYVFKARHAVMRRVVALKVIRPELLNDQEVVARFYREVRSLSRLNHPNIVHAFDAGSFGATHYLVMEYIEGTDLERLVRQTGPLSIAQAVDYIWQAATGLQCAHEHGLVHRDVKPSNLLVTLAPALSGSPGERSATVAPCGVVKILDLGLARGPRTGTEQTAAGLTQDGKGLMGTPDYLAPEQALELSQADIRSDLYSLGCVFYFLLTGQPPFSSGTLTEKLMRHQQAEPPDLSRFRSDVSPALALLIARLLAKQPAHRFPTPAALADALVRTVPRNGTAPAPSSLDVSTVIEQAPLTDWQGTKAVAAPVAHFAPTLPAGIAPAVTQDGPPTTRRLPLAVRRQRWLLFNIAGACVLVGLSLLFWVLLNVRSPVPPTAPTGPDVEVNNQSPALQELLNRLRKARSGGEDTERLRRDLLAFRTQNAGAAESLVASARLKELPSPFDALDPKAIAAEERLPWFPPDLVGVIGRHEAKAWGAIGSIAFSTDGTLLATGSTDGVVRVWDRATLREKAALKGHTGNVNGVAFGRGPILASVDEFNALHVWDLADLTRPKEIGNLKTADHSYHCLCVAISPDAKLIAAGGYDGRVKLLDVTPKGVRFRAFLPGAPGDLYTVGFSADGKTLFSGASDGLHVWDLTSATPAASPPVVAGLIRSLAVTVDNRVAFCVDCPRGLSLWDFPRGDDPREIAVLQAKTETYGPHRVAVSADGESLASNVAYDSAVRLWRKNGEGKFAPSGTLASGSGEVRALAFSPDGKTLAVGGSSHCVRLWSLDGGTVSPVLQEGLRPGGMGAPPSTPLGDTVAFATELESTLHFWNIGEAQPRPLASAPFPSNNRRWAMAFAADGSTFYTVSSQKVAQWSWSRGPAKIVSELPTSCNTETYLTQLALSANGKVLATASQYEPIIWTWDLSNGKPIERPQIKVPRGGCGAVTLAPDGNTLAALFDERTSDAQGNVSYHWTIRLWDLTSPTPAELPRLMESTGTHPMYPQFSPDGKQLGLLFPEEGKLELYDLGTEKPRVRIVFYAPPGTTLRAFLFTPDGRHIIGAGNGPQPLLIWDVATGKVIRSWGALPCSFNGVGLASDGRHLITGNGNGTAFIFRLPPPPGGLIAP
jgi:serine/threonine-protein kinase